MKLLELTVLINPADLAPWNGADVPIRFTIGETRVLMEIVSPPTKPSGMERPRQEFSRIASSLSGQSLEMMQLILSTESGEIARKVLVKQIWGDYIPTPGRVRNAIWMLNHCLAKLDFEYRIRSYRKGVLRLEPR